MLYYGNGDYIPEECKVFNLNSMKEGYPRFRFILPPNNLMNYKDKEFDIIYYNYLIQDNNAFTEFFSIIYELYIGNDVFIIVDQKMNWTENTSESIFKAIQQRYGYNAIQINSFEDYIWVKNSGFDSQFNPDYGLYNLDIDRDRYTYLIESARLQAGGEMIYVE